MSAQLIDGKHISTDLRQKIARRARELRQKGIVPSLAVILVGDNPASKSYVLAKKQACIENGIDSHDIDLPVSVKEEELLDHIYQLNADDTIHGILVQLPLPDHINESHVMATIAPEKDVDGFLAVNLGKLMLNQDTFIPCTPHGIIKLLHAIGKQIEGSHCVIVGRSNIVGKPLANLLMQKSPNGNATVTVCHSRTPRLTEYTSQADILVAAIGNPRMISGSMIKQGAVVIDVGVNRIADSSRKKGYRLVGDVDFDDVAAKASFITPVPGGVGPMTITMLLWNTVKAAGQCLDRKTL